MPEGLVMASLNGRRIHRAEVHVPRSGGWRADVVLDVGPVPSGAATLQIADLTLVGTVLPGIGGEDAPDLPHVVLAGGAGWDREIGDGKYSSGSAVRLSTVLRDLAALAGEPYDAPAEVMLPPAYEWTGSTATAPRRARDVLAELVTRGAIPTWRVAPDGRTRFDAWPATGEAASTCTVTSRDLAVGLRRCALTTRAASLLPGATLEGAPIDRVVFIEEAGALRADVYAEQPSAAPTLRRLVRALVLELFPWAERFGLTPAGDVEVKTASRKLNLAGSGDELKPLHRVDDNGNGGRLTAAGNVITWTDPYGVPQWSITIAGVGVAVAITPVGLSTATPGEIITKATTGSDRVRSG